MAKMPTDAQPYIIQDWMSKRVWPEETFATFEEARDRITEYANTQPEEDFDGICEDLYAVRVD